MEATFEKKSFEFKDYNIKELLGLPKDFEIDDIKILNNPDDKIIIISVSKGKITKQYDKGIGGY